MFDASLSRWLEGGAVHRSITVERVGKDKSGAAVFTAAASYGRTLAAVSEPCQSADEALTEIRLALEADAQAFTATKKG